MIGIRENLVFQAVAVKSVNPRVQIISVESERAPGFFASMKGFVHDLLVFFNEFLCI